MQYICAWCNQPISCPTDSHRPAATSHGICADCSARILEEARLQLFEQVSRLEEPILLIDGSAVIRKTNPAAALLLGRSPETLQGVPLQDLLACARCPRAPLGGVCTAWDDCPLHHAIRGVLEERRAAPMTLGLWIPACDTAPERAVKVRIRFLCDYILLGLEPAGKAMGCAEASGAHVP